MRLLTLLLFGLLLSTFPALAAGDDYDYPHADPLVATILGTPSGQRAPLAEDLPVRLIDLEVLPDHKVPDIFWYNEKLRCSLAYQKQKAPLIFVVAGTGAGFNSDKMLALQSIFYQAGFHVVGISSPTHANFITAASGSAAPGVLRRDARDLYRVMQKVYEEVKDDIDVSTFHLAGYSLGGAQAAFISQLDDEVKVFNFTKVLMINPPVSLYNSASRLDRMLDENVQGGAAGAGTFLREQMNRLAQIYSASDFVKFDNEFLYNIYRNASEPPKENNLAALIGISFRISAVNMMFATDVMTQSGFVVPKGAELDNNDDLDDYFRTLTYISFARYLDELLLPIAQAGNSQVTRQQVIDGSSLVAIEEYLRKTGKIGVVTNADDLILDAAELDYLRSVFGSRAKIYPTGGHCGNIDHQQVASYLAAYFTQSGAEGAKP